MTKKTKIQIIKTFIKISIVVFVLLVFIVLGLFVKPQQHFEDYNMKKWSEITPEQQLDIITNITNLLADLMKERDEILAMKVSQLGLSPDDTSVQSEGVEGENVNLTPQIAKQIGCAFVSWLEKKSGIPAYELKIGVGRDAHDCMLNRGIMHGGGLHTQKVTVQVREEK